MISYRKANLDDIPVLIDLRIEFMKEVMCIKDDLRDEEVRKSLLEYFNDMMPEDEFISWLAFE